MKRAVCLMVLLVLLTGCAGKQGELDRAMALRSRLLSHGVAFDAQITADYGDRTYGFAMACEADTQGNLTFTVTEPEAISGIRGSISAAGGKLTFDGEALAFGLLADGQLAPVSAPWLLLNTLRSGYLTNCTVEGDKLRLAIDDSYADDALHLDIWLDADDQPMRGEALWKGRRILTVAIQNFRFL